MNNSRIDIDKALLDPTSVFKSPKDVVNNNSLSKQQKIEILKRWAYDAKELEIADDENMTATGKASDILDDILRAIESLK